MAQIVDTNCEKLQTLYLHRTYFASNPLQAFLCCVDKICVGIRFSPNHWLYYCSVEKRSFPKSQTIGNNACSNQTSVSVFNSPLSVSNVIRLLNIKMFRKTYFYEIEY